MKKSLLLTGLIIVMTITHAQTIAYFEYIHQADSLSRHRQYEKAAGYYEKAMAQAGGKLLAKNGYRACRAFALAGKTDKAFQVLDLLTRTPLFADDQQLLSDEGLASLHQHPRWNEIQNAFKQKDSLLQRSSYKLQRTELELIFGDDKHYHMQLYAATEQPFVDTAEVSKLQRRVDAMDSEHLVIVQSILDKYGWPGADVIGREATDGIWEVIEHADGRPDLRKKYLPLLRKAVEAGTIDPEKLALMED